MTPEQALELLNNTVAQIQLNRNSHIELVKAVEVLRTAINKKTEIKPVEKS